MRLNTNMQVATPQLHILACSVQSHGDGLLVRGRGTHIGCDGIVGLTLWQAICQWSDDPHTPLQPLMNTTTKRNVNHKDRKTPRSIDRSNCSQFTMWAYTHTDRNTHKMPHKEQHSTLKHMGTTSQRNHTHTNHTERLHTNNRTMITVNWASYCMKMP